MTFERALCPRFHKAVELVGARWTGAIIQLLLPGQARFTELRLAIPEMSDRMLSERLRELEAEGIVHRTVIPEVPVRIEYALTDKGRALQSAMDAIAKWAERYVAVSQPARPASTPTRRPRRPRESSPARRPTRSR